MNIVSVKIKNFLSLADVEIKPGKITQIVGDNGDGKTSILKAIDFAVNGSKDPSLVRLGEDSAEVLVELSDATLIRRRLTSEGRQSVDVSREGMKATSPQALLDVLFDSSSFNPLELLDPKKRHDAIMNSIDLKLDAKALAAAIGVEEKDLPPLDYSQHGLKVLDHCYRYFYQRRAEANKDASEKKKRWETYRSDFKPAATPAMQRQEIELRRESCHVGIAQCKNHVERVKRSHEANKEAQEKLNLYCAEQSKIQTSIEVSEKTISTLAKDLENWEIELKKQYEEQVQKHKAEYARKESELKQQVAADKARLETSQKFIEEAKSKVQTVLEGDQQFVEEIANAEKELEQLKTAEKEIEAFEATERSRQMIDGMEQEYNVAEAFAQALDARVVLLGGKVKKDLMSGAEMPIEGLQYNDGAFFVEGSSVDNLSTAATMRLAVSVARKLSKKAKVICIDGAEALDGHTWQAFKKEIEGDGFTYFVTKVGGAHIDPDGTIIPMSKGQVMQ